MGKNLKIEVNNLKRYYGKTKAVDNVSFSFESGHVFGFIGPNGAGKTTTLRVLATLDEPTHGDILIDGFSIREEPERVRKLIGFVPDSLPTHSDITVHEYLDFFARAYGLQGKERDKAVSGVKEFTGLKVIEEKLLKSLSKGMKQRVSLGRSLIHDPSVLIMDEPAAGLDPRARLEFRELVTLLADLGKAILISSHILTELTEVCNGVVIIEKGKILETGTIETVLQRQTPTQTLSLRTLDDKEELRKTLLEMPHITDVCVSGEELFLDVDATEEARCDLLKDIISRGYRIAEFKQMRADLEDIFMNVTNGEIQ